MNCKAVNAPTTTFFNYLQTILIFVKTSRFIIFVDVENLVYTSNLSQIDLKITNVVLLFFSYYFFVKFKLYVQELLDGQKGWSSSDHSQDYGYSSENNIGSSGHSNPSSPEGSEVACSDGFCNHEGKTDGLIVLFFRHKKIVIREQ